MLDNRRRGGPSARLASSRNGGSEFARRSVRQVRLAYYVSRGICTRAWTGCNNQRFSSNRSCSTASGYVYALSFSAACWPFCFPQVSNQRTANAPPPDLWPLSQFRYSLAPLRPFRESPSPLVLLAFELNNCAASLLSKTAHVSPFRGEIAISLPRTFI
jgi:hypothetical protein